MFEALQSRFLEWIDTDNAAAAPRGPLQGGKHARVIRAGILADHDNAVCQFEIGEGHGALAGAEGLEHAHATRLVTHVRAVREIVGAELSHEQLIEKGGFVAGATRRVEHRLIGRRQRVQLAPDEIERGVPTDREVMGAPFRQIHRLREPPALAKPVITVFGQLHHRVLSEECRRNALTRGFLGNGLGAVLAELETGAFAVGIGPGAPGTVEPRFLIEVEQRRHRARHAHLRNGHFQRDRDRRQAAG